MLLFELFAPRPVGSPLVLHCTRPLEMDLGYALWLDVRLCLLGLLLLVELGLLSLCASRAPLSSVGYLDLSCTSSSWVSWTTSPSCLGTKARSEPQPYANNAVDERLVADLPADYHRRSATM